MKPSFSEINYGKMYFPTMELFVIDRRLIIARAGPWFQQMISLLTISLYTTFMASSTTNYNMWYIIPTEKHNYSTIKLKIN